MVRVGAIINNNMRSTAYIIGKGTRSKSTLHVNNNVHKHGVINITIIV